MTDNDDLDDRYKPTPGFVDMLRQRWIESGGAGKGNSEPETFGSPVLGHYGAVVKVALDGETMGALECASEDRGVPIERLVARAVGYWLSVAKSTR